MGSETKEQDLDIKKIMGMTVSKEEIEEKELSKDQLLEINIGAQLLGPVKQDDLKNHVLSLGLTSSNAEVRSLSGGEWKPLFEHPLLQKRSPQLVSKEELEPETHEDFYVLKNGRKFGPFRFEQIEDKIQIQQILFTDLISVDGGETWAKIYEISSFNRRRKKEGDLPPPPQEKIFKDGNKRQKESLKSGGRSGEAEAMALLAKIGAKKPDATAPETLEDEDDNKADKSFKKFVGIIILGVFILGGFFVVKKFALKDKKSLTKSKSKRSRVSKKLFKPKNRNSKSKVSPSKINGQIGGSPGNNSRTNSGKTLTNDAMMKKFSGERNKDRDRDRDSDRDRDRERNNDDPYKDDYNDAEGGSKTDLRTIERNKLRDKRKKSRRKTGRKRRGNEIIDEDIPNPEEEKDSEFENEERE